ncbi:MAG: galactokinase, partial [Planctomycetota bacterium]
MNRDTAGQKFESIFGMGGPLRCARAPGRVNLIGEHTDYNGGFVLPMAIDRDVRFYFRENPGGKVRVWSEECEQADEFALDAPGYRSDAGWANYIRGVASVFQDAGYELRPVEGFLTGNVPIGSGLSSSAALEVASALALCREAAEGDMEGAELARLCQRAENEFVGVNCGIMDQFVSVHAEEERAVLIDCRSLDYRLLPVDNSRVHIVVCNTMVDHELGSSAYNERRATCEAAARALNQVCEDDVTQLRDVSMRELDSCKHALSDLQYRRARHVVAENERASAAVRALEGGDYPGFGQLMDASHDSLRDDYEVSCDELDCMVTIARRQEGCYGARMTGAGFGGCTVNLVKREAAAAFMRKVEQRYEEETGIGPEIYEFRA